MTLVTDDPELVTKIEQVMLRSDRVHVLAQRSLLHILEAPDGGGLTELIAQSDLFLFDWDLMQAPVLAQVQQHIGWSDVPLVMLCSDPTERDAALLGGGDVAITKPYTRLLFKALILALHRRMRAWHVLQAAQSPYAGRAQETAQIKGGLSGAPPSLARPAPTAILLMPRSLSVRIGDQIYVLTPRRFQLLSYFVENAGQVVSRDEILSNVWQTAADTGSNTVDVYVHYLRQLLNESRFQGRLETVRHVGYRLILPERV